MRFLLLILFLQTNNCFLIHFFFQIWPGYRRDASGPWQQRHKRAARGRNCCDFSDGKSHPPGKEDGRQAPDRIISSDQCHRNTATNVLHARVRQKSSSQPHQWRRRMAHARKSQSDLHLYRYQVTLTFFNIHYPSSFYQLARSLFYEVVSSFLPVFCRRR